MLRIYAFRNSPSHSLGRESIEISSSGKDLTIWHIEWEREYNTQLRDIIKEAHTHLYDDTRFEVCQNDFIFSIRKKKTLNRIYVLCWGEESERHNRVHINNSRGASSINTTIIRSFTIVECWARFALLLIRNLDFVATIFNQFLHYSKMSWNTIIFSSAFLFLFFFFIYFSSICVH